MIDALKNAVLDAVSRQASLAELAAILRTQREQGVTRSMALAALDELRTTADEHTADAILEIMDIVSGFGQPQYRVWSED